MKRTLILLAGPPATGKSYLISKMRDMIPDFFLITPDEIKEMYADKFGFNNLKEKSELEKKVWNFYYSILGQYMDVGKRIIVTEYPFSDRQKNKLKNLSEKYGYKVITIRLIAEFDTLWERRQARDVEESRHLSHLMTYYQADDELLDRTKADNHILKEEFATIIAGRRYNEFYLGTLYEVDVTDFSKVNYNSLLQKIKKEI